MATALVLTTLTGAIAAAPGASDENPTSSTTRVVATAAFATTAKAPSAEETDGSASPADVDALIETLDVAEYLPAEVVLEDIVSSQTEYAEAATAYEFAAATTAFEAAVAEIDAQLAANPGTAVAEILNTVVEQSSTTDAGIQLAAKRCVTVYKWQLQAFAWLAIFYAAAISIVGLASTATIAGAPVGAVLGSIGIGLGAYGSYVLWVVDRLAWSSKKVCW